MGIFTAVVLYVLLWWLCLFLVLPFWTRPMVEADRAAGGWRGTPEHPHLGRKIMATTVLTFLIWGGCMLVISHADWLSFRNGWLALPAD
jgi:predicted secreted protein